MPTMTPTPEIVGTAGVIEEAIDCVEERITEHQISEGVVTESKEELQHLLPQQQHSFTEVGLVFCVFPDFWAV